MISEIVRRPRRLSSYLQRSHVRYEFFVIFRFKNVANYEKQKNVRVKRFIWKTGARTRG